MAKKLPDIPDFLMSTPCNIVIESSGVSEDGEPIAAVKWSGNCRYSNKARESLDGNNKKLTILGAIQIKGDIAPALPAITGGTIEVGGAKFRIKEGKRSRNPDGSVHHTTLELI